MDRIITHGPADTSPAPKRFEPLAVFPVIRFSGRVIIPDSNGMSSNVDQTENVFPPVIDSVGGVLQ